MMDNPMGMGKAGYAKPTESPSTATVEGPSAVLTGVDPGPASAKEEGIPDLFDLSIPKIGAYRTQDHQYYFNGEGPLPGVTSIIDVLEKPALVQWAKNTVAGIAVDKWEEIGGMLHTDNVGLGSETRLPGKPNDPVRLNHVKRWLASLPDYQRDTAAKLGSGVHLLADLASRVEVALTPGATTEGFQLSPEERPYLQAFTNWMTWANEQDGKIISSEKMVWSEHGYAGTYDLLLRLPTTCEKHDPNSGSGSDQCMNCYQYASELWLVDIKTSKGYYPETALQLIAYGSADGIILEGNPSLYPMPIVQRYAVLHLRPDLYTDTGWRLIEYPLISSDFIAFLGALELYRWKKEGRYTKSKLSESLRG